ncbi:MAG: 4-(cytidine 5'-diphospho)-2-C-methyl-D-erythritol kinase [Proteiniphilum sp.]|nr:4-(cytidine 5'-diphospho)-2-C-methyl-D-erythritol kinase [Proteiniphilum sp.]MDD4800094.1 4-(cytidine 5'-diphospho)-2-C-methyl-D-erythritol kinase [Proteiniphilum sp.]
MIKFPNAKINLGLHVIARREDGYHDLETVFYPIGLKDALEIVPYAEGLPSAPGQRYQLEQTGLSLQGAAEENLVIKALKLISSEKAIPPVEIHLLKKIPFGAGLGGGSSDAAAMLQLLNDLFSLGYTEQQLITLAARLGADCAFFIRNQPALATGIGDILEPVDIDLGDLILVLVKPDIGIPTQTAYAMITPRKPAQSLREIVTLPVSEWKKRMKNDFEAPIFKKYPEIYRIKQQLYARGALYASMSGSGSSVYGLFQKEPDLNGLFGNHFVWTSCKL